MKIRIVQKNDGTYEVQTKKSFFSKWITNDWFNKLDEAQMLMLIIKDKRQKNKNRKWLNKIKGVVEVISI